MRLECVETVKKAGTGLDRLPFGCPQYLIGSWDLAILPSARYLCTSWIASAAALLLCLSTSTSKCCQRLSKKKKNPTNWHFSLACHNSLNSRYNLSDDSGFHNTIQITSKKIYRQITDFFFNYFSYTNPILFNSVKPAANNKKCYSVLFFFFNSTVFFPPQIL